jgi:hypothetical protein
LAQPTKGHPEFQWDGSLFLKGEVMAEIKVMLPRKYKGYPRGYRVQMWGYDFIVQKDGSLVASVPESHVKPGIKSGRYLLYEKEKAKEDKIDTTYLDTFGYDVGTYYGAGSLEALRKKISQLRKNELQLFAESRLDVKFTAKTGKDRMVTEVLEYVKGDIAKEEEQFAELESKVKEPVKENTSEKVSAQTDPESEPVTPQTKEELLAELDEIEKKIKSQKEK